MAARTDPAADTFPVFGTTATLLVTDPGSLADARRITDAELAAVDRACNRFRPDSELSILNGAGGSVTPVSELFAELLDAALRAARLTDGAVDPACGQALIAIGYDRDFSRLRQASQGWNDFPRQRAVSKAARRRKAIQRKAILLDRARNRVRLADGALLDLGAIAKAWAADRCAGLAAAAAGCGVLVSLGGDIAVAGDPPPGGWQVRVTDDHAAGPDEPGQTVTICSGGLATSSTTVRTWTSPGSGRRMHHIVDPATGEPAVSCWRTVSVAAATCADANTASTAAIIRSQAAPAWLQAAGLPARLVRHDGSALTLGGWPPDTCQVTGRT